MAVDTPKSLRQQVMYSVFVRNYSPEGTFEALERDLPRLKALGVDVVWLMPIHPIGRVCRKGTLGSPYAIRDYRAVNPEYGTLEDFVRLTEAIHAQGMRVIIDVVYNHTSPDSVLVETHPEWFYRKPDGGFGNHVGDWSDIIDLDYNHPDLWDYQIGTLKYWAQWVDGFRCDVAPLVPLDFWKHARAEVAKVRPDALWLAESVEPGFITDLRAQGLTALSDGETYQAFDVCYDYDIAGEFVAAATGEGSLSDYCAAVNRQEYIYPDNYVKLRFLENHDRPRVAALLPSRRLEAWTAFAFFQKGMTLLYNGQEAGCARRPGLFDRDVIDWNSGRDLSELIRRLSRVKRHPLMAEGAYRVAASPDGTLRAEYRKGDRRLLGFFPVGPVAAPQRVDLPDGDYPNLLGGAPVHVACGLLAATEDAAVLEA